MFDVIVIGGGAAGFYGAIHMARTNSKLKIGIFERGKNVLSKVKVSGGGRCNVTHAEFLPHELIKNYPRGEKELLGPFHRHATADTMAFFQDGGISLKVEEDGRVFPESDSSQTIIDFFLSEAEKLNIKIFKNYQAKEFAFIENDCLWQVTTKNKHYYAKKLLLATGSNTRIWKQLEQMGHTIIDPVPSLFTFNSDDPRIKGLQGVSAQAHVAVMPKEQYNTNIGIELKSNIAKEPALVSEGPVLITHWGLSGPAILKLSAWGANLLHDHRYNFRIIVNWTPEYSTASMFEFLKHVKEVEPKKTVLKGQAVEVPKRLWGKLVKAAAIDSSMRWADTPNEKLKNLAKQLTACSFKIHGKSTFKDEFVTAGGVDLREINFKTFESRILPNLYFAGEVINVDAITGGFNFQNAWTGAYIAARAIATDD
ncbi:NAD(P)/FAD-dependent oxidoreductase [Allomuricauda sp. SCSIO 65647]|uniref:NAD(P)/FAD-dependent oxidoreductase n=1 Tax=Allomuricauda sp. SCSIO 65647 TaxID=2908843 RepID=UPI001F3A1BFE|nr:NAD(P)/FAD-dependent oxidoreductase [Muricauda sp. SCSIO 65647]UJH66252.1 NAD(P)/FAD-dependent oxidoreductase [Muricauda sp. SCSIO 65647]